MTLLVSWVGVDPHGITSAYIAADSRVSWGDAATFDYGRKVFAFRNSPDILGYCGDVLFPTMVLSQITDMADRGLLFSQKTTRKQRFEAIKEKIVQQLFNYPSMVVGITAPTLQVIYISRDPIQNTEFSCWVIKWSRNHGWTVKSIKMPPTSGVLFSLGSGSSEFNKNYERYEDGPNHDTTRSIFHCFCDTLFNIKDNKCGGAPQLVGIYRKPESAAITYGIIRENKRYFLGAQIDKDVDFETVEWRNDLFELCDGLTMKRRPEAQAQPDKLRRK
ncbi:MAG: hypothetical protein ACYCYR_05235 [Desulfobulbaceae bacterium]